MPSSRRSFRPIIVTTALAALSLAGCGSDPAGTAPSSSSTTQASPSNTLGPVQLSIVTRDTSTADPATHTLTCSPPGGTVQDPAAACAQLAAAGGAAALRLDPEKMCTQQVAGPARASITGTISGKQVGARLAQSDGCRIAQWNSLSELLGSRAGD